MRHAGASRPACTPPPPSQKPTPLSPLPFCIEPKCPTISPPIALLFREPMPSKSTTGRRHYSPSTGHLPSLAPYKSRLGAPPFFTVLIPLSSFALPHQQITPDELDSTLFFPFIIGPILTLRSLFPLSRRVFADCSTAHRAFQQAHCLTMAMGPR
jgi:hypothetical protein